MMPSTVKFASRMKKMGVGDGMRIVVYDSYGLFSAARAWWQFRVMGHNDVAVLNGGLKKWKEEGRPLEDGPPPRRSERHYTPRLNADLIRDLEEMRALVGKRSAQIVDARSPGRFAGAEPEPRPGVKGGHIPGSSNALRDAAQSGRDAQEQGRARPRVRRGRDQPVGAGGHDVRLGRDGLDPVARARRARPDERSGLRRQLGRMGVGGERPARRDRLGPRARGQRLSVGAALGEARRVQSS